MPRINYINEKCFKVSFGEIPAYTLSMKIKDLDVISYVAVRGKDQEKGAVQRVLNKGRIDKIKSYLLEGNQFFNSFIMNWTDTAHNFSVDNDIIKIPLVPSSAQMIDGQHRLEGLRAAMMEKPEIGEGRIIVTVCNNLTTAQAAKIFLNINTEQRPVPKTLIYDLFGEAEPNKQHAINRATDIARSLNEDPNSALYKMIKFPAAPKGYGNIELSTFVSAIKPALEINGKFHSVNLDGFDHQKTVINNYFEAIRTFYKKEHIWEYKNKNPFLMASGFNGAIDFLKNTLIEKCADQKSFEVSTIQNLLKLDKDALLLRDDLKGLDGKTARKKVEDYLGRYISNLYVDSHEYAF
jgi:DGQHR domain-containing protein